MEKMRTAIALAMLLCMCLALSLQVAAEDFVPSVTYKDGINALSARLGDASAGDCVVVSSIKEAREKTTDIEQAARDELLEVYEKLSDGSMKLPLEGNYVILELVDISFAKTTCVDDSEHPHLEELEKENTSITVDLGYLRAGSDLQVLQYDDGVWTPIKKAVYNEDGTVTCEFEHFCPVAFCVDEAVMDHTPQTGDSSQVFLWVGVLLVSAAALITLVLSGRRRAK